MSWSTRQLLTDPLPRLLIVWLICLGVAAQRLRHAVIEFDADPGTPADQVRADGNNGHTHIDFGGQWLMGRMIVSGHGPELFHRNRQWEVARAGFPRAAEEPRTRALAFPEELRPAALDESDARHDAENLMSWVMGKDSPAWNRLSPLVALPLAGSGPLDTAVLLTVSQRETTPELIAELETPAIGGPLYPPVHALLYSPLGLMEPKRAYRLLQLVSVVLAVACGWFVRVISGGRVWTPVAAAVILLFPGCRSGLDLGQNHVLTLAVVLGGWALASRNRDFAGGAVWGLLAFKPVWGLAFAVVPLLLGRWRFLAGLAVSGFGLILLTLPVVGVQAWSDWLAVGREAAALYDVNENWIGLSRDLAGIVRRPLIDFTLPQHERGSPLANQLSWAVWGTVLLVTAAVHRLRRHRPEAEGFLVLGAYLTCYRFMYYDALLAVVPFAVLAAHWRPMSFRATVTSFPAVMLLLLLLAENWLMGLDLRATFALGYLEKPPLPGSTEPRVPEIRYATDHHHATDTVLLLVLWAGLAVKMLRQPRSSSSAAPMSGDRMSDSPTRTA